MNQVWSLCDNYVRSYSQLSEFDLFCLTLTLTSDAHNRLFPVHNIQGYFDRFSSIYVSEILTLGKLFKVKVKSQGKVIFGAAFQKQKYEPIWSLCDH